MSVKRIVETDMWLEMKIAIMEIILLLAGNVEQDVNQVLLMVGTVQTQILEVEGYKQHVLRSLLTALSLGLKLVMMELMTVEDANKTEKEFVEVGYVMTWVRTQQQQHVLRIAETGFE